MIRIPRARTLIGAAAVALLLTSCGVDAGDAAPATDDGTTATTAVTPDTDRSPQQQQMADAYRDLGFTDEEADCLADGLGDSLGGAEPDFSGIMDTINQCDIPLDRLLDVQGELGDGSAEGALKDSMATGFRASGLSDEEATCVADAFVDQYGLDVEAMIDQDKMVALAEDCGVDPSKIRPGG